jgi:glycosyltransferase involved in cell wall biosynthesis
MKTIFILLPSPHPTGPVKGAYALANALACLRRVVIVFLKNGPGVEAPLDSRVCVKSLAETCGGWRNRVAAYRELLQSAGGRKFACSISMCLSADFVNCFCRSEAVTCSSIRGNLFQNYRFDYGWSGAIIALGHLLMMHALDHVIAMNKAMALQIRRYAALKPIIIGNFVDEVMLEQYRVEKANSGQLRFVFVGSLSVRKQPELLIYAVDKLREYDVEIDFLGDGPLRKKMAVLIKSLGLSGRIRLHGQVADPYPIVATADAFVMPSLSEGVSRAVLEALHLGVPCILREVDGNSELFADLEVGSLFEIETELPEVMLSVAKSARKRAEKISLLPNSFRQSIAAANYLALLEDST